MILLGALVVLDVLALLFGVDSRDLIDRNGRIRQSGLDVTDHAIQ